MVQASDPKMQECIRQSDLAYQSCVLTLIHCLGVGGEHAEASHIRLLQDCAEITQLNEAVTLRGSDFMKEINEICARVCDTCADECEEMDPEDEVMQSCAEACRNCAEACRGME